MNADQHLAALKAARLEERDKCCRDVCHFCRRGKKPRRGPRPSEWYHDEKVPGDQVELAMYCAASAIHARAG